MARRPNWQRFLPKGTPIAYRAEHAVVIRHDPKRKRIWVRIRMDIRGTAFPAPDGRHNVTYVMQQREGITWVRADDLQAAAAFHAARLLLR